MDSSEMLPSARLRLRRRVASTSGLGGITKMLTDSGIWRRTCAAPCTSMSSSRSFPCFARVGQRVARRAVEVAEDIRRFEKLIVPLHTLESRAIDVVIFAALLFGAARVARGVTDGKSRPLTSDRN